MVQILVVGKIFRSMRNTGMIFIISRYISFCFFFPSLSLYRDDAPIILKTYPLQY